MLNQIHRAFSDIIKEIWSRSYEFRSNKRHKLWEIRNRVSYEETRGANNSCLMLNSDQPSRG